MTNKKTTLFQANGNFHCSATTNSVQPVDHALLPSTIDVAVLLLFFNRPALFCQVFEQVRAARPSRLFLYQDGPRDEQDVPGIEACREIASQVDWACDVRRNYQQHNQGCFASGFRAHQWAFSLADKVMVLEDDVVPSLSFFRFCKEMLDRYETDLRVMMIAGYNVDEQSTDIAADYFFTSVFSIWGWASWRRVAQLWDSQYSFMKDAYNLNQLKALIKQRRYRPDLMRMLKEHSQAGVENFETIYWAAMLLNSGLTLMPAKNLITNIGITPDSTHFMASLKTTPRRLRRVYTMRRLELDFPLHHPKTIVDHIAYKQRVYKVFAWGHPLTKFRYSVEELFLNLRYGNFRTIGKAMLRRLKKAVAHFMR